MFANLLKTSIKKTMKNFSNQKMTPFPHILTDGGDDRLILNPKTKTNKYFCTPDLRTDVLFRGSCTCNLATSLGYNAA